MLRDVYAGQLDIPPTVLGLLGVPAAGEVMLGHDLLAPRDPLVTFERILLGEGAITREEADAVRERVAEQVEAAVAFAEASPPVPESELAREVYANPWNDDPRGSAVVGP